MIEPHHITMLARLKGVTLARHIEADMQPGFLQTSKMAWAESALKNVDYYDEVHVGWYSKNSEGGTTGEFSFQFGRFSDPGSARLAGGGRWMRTRIYCDGWNALANMPELIVALAQRDTFGGENQSPTPEEFCEMLVRIGIEDRGLRYRK
jgi:hypothetical protein